MRKNRLIWFVLWIASLVGISNYGGAVSYGFFAFMTVLPVMALIYLLFVYFSFRIYQELDSRNLTGHKKVPFYFTLQNESFFGFCSIRVLFFADFSGISGLDEKTVYELQPHEGIRLQTGLVCKYRGEYEVGIEKVEIQDYLRLFRMTYRNKETLRVIVKPRLVHLEQIQFGRLLQHKSLDYQRGMQQPDVLSREYAPGDSFRQIHWKASAVAGKLMTKRQLGEQQPGVNILLDTHRVGREQMEYLPVENRMLEVVLALSLYFVKSQIPVTATFTENDRRELTVHHVAEFDEYYQNISNIRFDESYLRKRLYDACMEQGSGFHTGMMVYVTSDWDEESWGFVQYLSENGTPVTVYHVSAVWDRVESSMPVNEVELIHMPVDGEPESML